MNTRDALSIKAVLYKSKTLANGQHPILIRITRNRKPKYKSLGISCDVKQWDEKNGFPKRSHPDKDVIEKIIAKKVAEYKTKKLEFQSEGKQFTTDTLMQAVEKPSRRVTVFQYLDELIQRLIASNQYGNSKVYKSCKLAVSNFTKGKDITFSDIDYSFLLKFETHLRKKGIADTTLSLYFRQLRATYNRAIQERIARESDYPFRKFKFSKFNLQTQKRALNKDDIKKIETLKIDEQSTMFEARQYFIFSYYGQGINFVDIANLKWKNMINGRVFYTRAKTGKIMNFVVLEPANEILEYWRPITNGSPENYIFPILNNQKHITQVQIHNRIHKVLSRVNKDLGEIASTLGINVPLTTYVARHSFATVLKKSNVSTAIISEMMGHQTEAITNTYLKNFENEIIDEAVKQLI